MKRIVVICLFVVLLVSCITERYFLSDDDLIWMSPYEYGDTILYKSGKSIDSLFIKEKMVSNDYELFADRFEKNYSYGTASYDGKMLHNGDSLWVLFLVQRPSESYLRFIFSFSERAKWHCINDGSSLKTKSVNGEVINDIVFLDSAMLKWDEYVRSPYNVKYLMWSKSKGLLQYEYLSTDSTKGGVYTFYKKLPYNKPKKGLKDLWNELMGE
ncbi:MAG: hypothetical protein J5663_04050 [Bacteroidaceae bacterium]|nr:hypothetical protein [Bacteroidaceae bacterium]